MKKKFTNVTAQKEYEQEIVETDENILRKKLVLFNISGMSFKEKKDLITDELIRIYGKLPKGLSITKMRTKPDEINPDGLRVLVNCVWIKRNRFYDYKGLFKIGRLVKAINKQILGKTHKNIVKEHFEI